MIASSTTVLQHHDSGKRNEKRRLLHELLLYCGCNRIRRKFLIITVKLKRGDFVHDFRL